MSKMLRTGWLLIFISGLAFAQKPATSPANEPPAVRALRSIHSIGADLNVPLCPAHFHDSLRANGIAGPNDHDVTEPKLKTKVPALVTQQAIAGSGRTHIGNLIVVVNVVVDKNGFPQDLCLQKSSGYGLDASAAAAVDQYRFEPARKDGKAVKTRVPVEVRFASQTPPESSQPIPARPTS